MNAAWKILLKRFLFAVPIVILLLPAVQAKYHLFELAELGGYAEEVPDPEFHWSDLRSNTYQSALEKYIEGHIGFREWLIRLRNQLSYSLFRSTHADDIIVGHDDILYGETNIKCFLGVDYVGAAEIQRHIRKFKSVQDSLARRNILTVFVFAPSKANYFQEEMPDYYLRQPRRRSNYLAYTEQMKASGINFLDLNKAFRDSKDTTAYPLFPRGGIHWSGYGMKRGGIMLVDYLEQKLHADLPDYKQVGLEVSDEARDTDNDMAKAINLFWEPAAYTMGYPNVDIEPVKPGQKKPNVLIIGDSFVYNIFTPFVTKVFDEKSRFWYYGKPETTDPNFDYKQQFLSSDVILVLFTEHNLIGFDGGFSDRAYQILNPYTPDDLRIIQTIEDKIHREPGVQERLWQYSTETGFSIDLLIHWEAQARFEKTRQPK